MATEIFLRDYSPPSYTASDVDLHFDLSPEDTRIRCTSTYVRGDTASADLVLDGDRKPANMRLVNLQFGKDNARGC
jgi:aminopeptidase N